MTSLKNFSSNPRIFNFLQRTISSHTSAPNPKPQTLSSLFSATKPSPNLSSKPKPSPKGVKNHLSSVFAKKPPNPPTPKKPSANGGFQRVEEKEFPKELSPEATMLVGRLIGDGYLKDANFARGEEQLEPHQIPRTSYSRHFLKTAAEKFGRDQQEVAKWLSGSELKKVALFGCPSTERNSVFAAKRLRAFFHIQEDVICRGCKLKTSCRFPNRRVGTVDKVILEDVMRLITVYTLDSIPAQLVVPDELKCSIGKLVKEAVNLSN